MSVNHLFRWLVLSAVLVVLILSPPHNAFADTAIFQQGVNGYSGTVDTFLNEAALDVSHGDLTEFKWGKEKSNRQVFGLIRFDDVFGSDPGQIPPGATIISAAISYNVMECGFAAVVNELHMDWNEDVTYNTFGEDAGVQSDEYGPDIGGAISSAGKGYFSVDVTSSIRSWLINPSANKGWIFRPTKKRVAELGSSENPTLAKRPRLVVEYLPPPTGVRIYPDTIDTVIGSADIPVSVSIPIGSNDNRPVRVTLTTNNADVAVPVAATNNSFVIIFSQGGITQQDVNIDIGQIGNAVITSTNDAELSNDSLAVKVGKGAVKFKPGMLAAGIGYKIPIKVAISPGGNDTRNVRVTLTTGKPAIAGPARAVGQKRVLNFVKGGPAEQIVVIESKQEGRTSIITDNDSGLDNTALPLEVMQSFEFTVTCDMRSYTGPTGFPLVLDAITATGGPGEFMVCPGDIDPPDVVDAKLDEEFGTDFPWYPVVGNHEEETASDMAWIRNEVPTLPYVVNTGPPGSETTNYSFEYGDTHFVMINEYANGTNCDDCLDGNMVLEMRNWLDADLAANTKKWVFVAGHEPAYPQPDVDWGDSRHIGDSLDKYPSNRNAFWAQLDTYDVAAFFVGHTHRYSRYLQNDVWQVDAAQARGNGQYDTFIRVFVGTNQLIYHTYRSLTGGVFALTDSWTAYWTGGPRIDLNKTSLDHTIYLGDPLPNDTFTVTNGGPDTINYTITDDADWLSVDPPSGASSGEADIINVIYGGVTALPKGQHAALISVASAEANNSPQTITVNLTVETVSPDFNGDGDVDQ
ncbi:MAG: DNRLRE domain-containing protein, partial [Planctomycetota bacterium]